jgi:hypothetical protein
MVDQQKSFSESGTSPPRRVTVTHVDLVPGCTAGTGVGLDARGNEATFAGDWRPLLQCAEALDSGEAVEVPLDESQVTAYRGAVR